MRQFLQFRFTQTRRDVAELNQIWNDIGHSSMYKAIVLDFTYLAAF